MSVYLFHFQKLIIKKSSQKTGNCLECVFFFFLQKTKTASQLIVTILSWLKELYMQFFLWWKLLMGADHSHEVMHCDKEGHFNESKLSWCFKPEINTVINRKLALSLSLSDFILHFQILFNLLCFHPLFTEAPSLCLYIFTSSGYF